MADSQVDHAKEFLLGIEPDDLLRFTLEGADEQQGDAADLEHVGDFGVFLDVDAVEIDRALVMMGQITQDGLQASAGLAPVGIEIDHHRALILHDPVAGAPVGNDLAELLLCHVVNGIDRVQQQLSIRLVIPLGAGSERCQRQEQ